MSTNAINQKQIETQIKSIRRKLKHDSQGIAIRVSGEWTGPEHLSLGDQAHLITRCHSDLQMREALKRAEEGNEIAVLLCSVEDAAIGEDIFDRLARSRVIPLELDEAVAELFSVKPERIDPRITKNKALMTALVNCAPPDGYPSTTGGMLDLQTAWLTWLSQYMGETVSEPSLNQLLQWSVSEPSLKRLVELDPGLRESFQNWFIQYKGEAARFVFAALDSGYGSDLIALGLAMGVVFDPERANQSSNQRALGNIDGYLKKLKIDGGSALAWRRAAMDCLESIPERMQMGQLRRLDKMLGEIGLENNSWVSIYSPRGLDQRFDQAGEALQRALKSSGASRMEAVVDSLNRIREHRLSNRNSSRVERLEMACRLIYWLETREGLPVSKGLDVLSRDYVRDGAFLEWARRRLKETDESPVLQKGFDDLFGKVSEWFAEFEKIFAKELQIWTREGRQSDRLIHIEDVLEKALLPVAKQRPALLLVMDGMSAADFRSLLSELTRENWMEIENDSLELPSPVLAALPSVTQISRRALFLGRLDTESRGTEEGEFKNNDLIFKGSGGQVKPQLFKIGDLSEEGQGGLSDQVSKAIGDKRARVVSVIINAIDDHLDSGKQVDVAWNLNTIRGLRALLRLAADAGRWVVLTSDHGHILDFGAKILTSEKDGRGDRFRAADGRIEDGELEFEGDRVCAPGGNRRVTLAYSSRIRYGAIKRGYHGGASPHEMVAPLAILAQNEQELPEGWSEIPSFEPSWWRMESVPKAPAPAIEAKVDKSVEGLDLFEHVAAKGKTQDAWITSLLESDLYREQCRLAPRGGPDRAAVEKLLSQLDLWGGSVMKSTLAQELGMPPFRVDGFIQTLGRVFNVDGYEALTLDRASDTVKLNVEILKTQFDIQDRK